MGEQSNVCSLRMQNDLHRAEMKLRILNKIRRDARLLHAERNDIIKKMNTLQQLSSEVSNLKDKMNTCDDIINKLESTNTEIKKAIKDIENEDKVNGGLMDRTMDLMERVETLEKANSALINEYEKLASKKNIRQLENVDRYKVGDSKLNG